jgi:hypothetical protein
MQTKLQSENGANSQSGTENLNCWKEGPNPLCLRIELNDGTQFLMPYGYFESAKLVRENETDVLNLKFKSNCCLVKGSGLTQLLMSLQTFTVEWIKECPRRYGVLARSSVFIEQINIGSSGDDGS